MLVRLVVTGLVAAGLMLAQGGRGGGMGGDEGMGGDRMGGGMGGGAPRAQRQTKAQMLAAKLKLNNDQKEELQKIFTEEAQKARPVVDAINAQRQTIARALLAKKSEGEIQPLLAEYTKVSTQMTAIEAETFGKVYAMLKPNQRKNAAQAFDYLGGIYMPTMVAGRGGRQRGTRGAGEGGGERGGRN